jgi:hypothetical protein
VPAERIKELNTKNRFNLTRTLPYRWKVVRQADGKWCVKRFIAYCYYHYDVRRELAGRYVYQRRMVESTRVRECEKQQTGVSNLYARVGIFELTEGLLNLLSKLSIVSLDDLLALGWELELHRCDLVDEVVQARLDDGKRNLVVGLCGGLNSSLAEIIEQNDVFEHAACLVERAEAIVVGETVLLQKVLANNLGNLENDLV